MMDAVERAYLLWSKGFDLADFYSRSSLYRLRREFKNRGYSETRERDTPPPRPPCTAEPVAVGRLFTVPDWAVGTPMYFEPKRPKDALNS